MKECINYADPPHSLVKYSKNTLPDSYIDDEKGQVKANNLKRNSIVLLRFIKVTKTQILKMNLITVYSVLLALTEFSSAFLFISTRKWIKKSHLDELDSSLFFDFYWTFITTTASLITTMMIVKRKQGFVHVILSIIILLQSFYEFYRGFFMFYSPIAFIATFGPSWIEVRKSKIVYSISKEFKCCGFHSVNEFNRTCKYINQNPCLTAINNSLGETIKITGKIMVGQSFSHSIASFALLYDFLKSCSVLQ